MRTSSSPTASRTARSATCTTPSGSQAPLPCGVLARRHAEEDEPGHARARPAAWPRPPASRRVCCTSPGMDAIGTGAVDPLPHEERGHQVVDAEARLGDQAPQGRRAAQPAQRGVREAPPARSGSGVGLGHRPSLRGRRPPPGPKWSDQLGDDALRGRRPRPRARRRARPPGPPRPSSARCRRRARRRGHRPRRPGSRSATKACTDEVAVNVERVGRGHPVQQRRLGRGDAAPCGRPRPVAPSQPFSREPVGDGVGGEVGAREQARAHGARRPARRGTPRPARARCARPAPGRARRPAGAARRRWPARPRPPARRPRARASRSSAMKRSTALTEVSTTQSYVAHGRRRRGPQRGPAVGRRRPGGSAAARAPSRPRARARPPGRAARWPERVTTTVRPASGPRRHAPAAASTRPSAATGPTTMTAGGPRSTSARPASVVRTTRWRGGRPPVDHGHRRVRRRARPAPARRRWRPGSSCP